MATQLRLVGDVPAIEATAAPLRPVARWFVTTDEDGRTGLRMRWAVPQLENIAAVADSTSAY